MDLRPDLRGPHGLVGGGGAGPDAELDVVGGRGRDAVGEVADDECEEVGGHPQRVLVHVPHVARVPHQHGLLADGHVADGGHVRGAAPVDLEQDTVISGYICINNCIICVSTIF